MVAWAKAPRAEAGRSAEAVDVAADRTTPPAGRVAARYRGPCRRHVLGEVCATKANPTVSHGSAGPACAVIVAMGKVRRLGRRRRARRALRRRPHRTGKTTILERA